MSPEDDSIIIGTDAAMQEWILAKLSQNQELQYNLTTEKIRLPEGISICDSFMVIRIISATNSALQQMVIDGECDAVLCTQGLSDPGLREYGVYRSGDEGSTFYNCYLGLGLQRERSDIARKFSFSPGREIRGLLGDVFHPYGVMVPPPGNASPCSTDVF